MRRVGRVVLVLWCIVIGLVFLASVVLGVWEENACLVAGFDVPIVYRGEVYCFGREGKPEIVLIGVW